MIQLTVGKDYLWEKDAETLIPVTLLSLPRMVIPPEAAPATGPITYPSPGNAIPMCDVRDLETEEELLVPASSLSPL
jgi:hypothetical protein